MIICFSVLLSNILHILCCNFNSTLYNFTDVSRLRVYLQTVFFQKQVDNIKSQLFKTQVQLQLSKAQRNKDQKIQNSNKIRVDRWSMVQCVFMILMATVQVRTLLSQFTCFSKNHIARLDRYRHTFFKLLSVIICKTVSPLADYAIFLLPSV